MEILAPAGNEASLKAAVACGADAVYLGTKNFNARSKADNFSDEQLRLAVLYCHERGVRVYITLNTLVKDSEIAAAIQAVENADNAGADAFLVQDLGLYQILRRKFPEISFHASTQLGVHNLPGAIMAEKLGFDRVVLSRETLPKDIAAIKQNTKLEIEFFVHGAHCVSFSGNCYFSAMVSGYSGNRGKCLQLCRKKYELFCGNKRTSGYMLSAKDICLLPDIKKLASAGVDSLKIEGRLRSAEYVGVATDVYKRALESKPQTEDFDRLKTVFNRGNFSRAYIAEDRPEIVYSVQQNNIGLNVGRVSAVSRDILVPDRKINVKNGNGYKILRNGSEVGSANALSGKIYFRGRVMKGDDVCLTKSADMEEWLTQKRKLAKIKDKIEKNTRKNQCTLSDIVTIPYVLPDRCLILQTDENGYGDFLPQSDLIIFSPTAYNIAIVAEFVKKCRVPVLLDLPVEARGHDIELLEKMIESDLVSGYVANNIYAFELCKTAPVLCGAQMNSISTALNVPRIMSPESAFIDDNAVVCAFGRTVLMNLTHCPKLQSGYVCRDCERGDSASLRLRDEMKNDFALRRKRLSYCYWELLNGKITNLFPKLDKNKHKRVLIDIRNVTYEQARAAFDHTYDLRFDDRAHTYGRFGKGVK